MTDSRTTMLEKRRIEVLRYDYWDCKLCEDIIDAGTTVGSDDDKTRLLISHLKTRHKDSRDVDSLIEEKYLVLYFKPRVEIVQPNEKFI